jgi:DNA polymerase-3 subunit delta
MENQILAVLGSDEAEVKQQALNLAKVHAPADGDEFAIDTIDGAAENVEEAERALIQTCETLQTLPFFGGKLVWLKNANMFADSVIGRSERILEVADHLMGLLQQGLPDGVTFLLSATDIDKRRGFYKKLTKLTKPRVFDKIDTGRAGWQKQVRGVVNDYARRHNFQFAPDALEEFVELVGGNKHQIYAELEKLDLYRGTNRQIHLEDVHALVPRSQAGIIWQLSTMITQRDTRGAVRMANDLLEQGENPLGILYAAVIPTVRNMLLVRDLMDRYNIRPPQYAGQFKGVLDRLGAEATGHLPRKKDGTVNVFGLGSAAPGAAHYTTAELRVALEECLRTVRAFVSTSIEPGVLISTLIVKIVAPKPGTAGAESRQARRAAG